MTAKRDALEAIVTTIGEDNAPYSWRYPSGRHWKRLVKDVSIYSKSSLAASGMTAEAQDHWMAVCDEINRIVEIIGKAAASQAKGTPARMRLFATIAQREHNKAAGIERKHA